MEVAAATATSLTTLRARSPAIIPSSTRNLRSKVRCTSSSSLRASLSNGLLSPYTGGSISSDFCGAKLRPESLNPLNMSSSKPKRGVVTMVYISHRFSINKALHFNLQCLLITFTFGEILFVFMALLSVLASFHQQVIPFSKGSAHEQPPPDLASYLFKNRIVYLGMSLVPSVTELILAEFLYLQYEDEEKPIYLYINSTGTTKNGEKLGYDTEAFAIYDVMGYVKPPIFTLCVGNAWGEAALLLTAGAKGNRSALPSSTIMIKQPIARFQGQATDVEIARKEIRHIKTEMVKLYSKHIGKSPEQIEADMKRPKYFSPSEAVEYGIIDKVVYNERSSQDRGVVSDLKKAQLI
ncbi:hypothetical protein HID58_001840 [Brassica napus]|uniref:ATP-dependent Clp protease proteolytic subunit n=1 Tax=Brassica napus TaxID=3708 RepID=A0ABQ8ENC1_BRANA|nr:hypothetical protein HID58_001840 [Brassica napus]